MPDDSKRTALDRKLISLDEAYEVSSWSRSFGCTPEQLREAVRKVGPSAEAVREYLKAPH